jgi:peptidoglycan/LPS O-acetylase OafA/YrhL
MPRRWVAWFQFGIGIAIVWLWTVLLITEQVPEVEAGETKIWFHIVAELFTGILLLWSGRRGLRRPAPVSSALALGALLYTSITSAGYYADREEWVVVALFGVLVGATALAVRAVLRAETGAVDA